jgi:hypothetical protein
MSEDLAIFMSKLLNFIHNPVSGCIRRNRSEEMFTELVVKIPCDTGSLTCVIIDAGFLKKN